MSNPYHNPPHLYFHNAIYFVSCRTINRIPYFNTSDKKEILANQIKKSVQKYHSNLFAWIVVENHYHLLFRIKMGEDLSKLMQMINGGSSYKINKLENQIDRKIWHNYWDICLRGSKAFWTHFNYIHHNAIKHKCVPNIESLVNYQFFSYPKIVKIKGSKWMNEVMSKYPIVDFSIEDD